jgi:hypothetical protein
VHWRRVLSFVLLCAFTISLSTLAVYFVRDLRERDALRELGDRAAERAFALTSWLAEARGRGGLEGFRLTKLGQQSVVLDPGLAFVAHPRLGARRGVLLPVEVAESLQQGAPRPLLVQDYRDPLDATGTRWLAAFAPVGRTGYFSALQVRAPKLALGTAFSLGLALAALLWVLSSRSRTSRGHVRA